MLTKPLLALVVITVAAISTAVQSEWARTQATGSQPVQSAPAHELTEEDALGVLGHLGDALESHNVRGFLSAFDADRMSDYPVFRDQVNAFFQQYESFQVSYKLSQVAMEGSNGVTLAEFTIDSRPTGGDQPDVRKSVSLRLVLGWNGKEWKIIDLSPREFFS